VKMVEQCCGHDGTWAMRKEFFPLSLLAGKKAFDQMQAVEAKVMATIARWRPFSFSRRLGSARFIPSRYWREPTAPTASQSHNPPEEKV